MDKNTIVTYSNKETTSKPTSIPKGNNWVGTWATSTYLTESENMPPISLSNNTLRQVIRVSLGGNKIRFKFSNRLGNSSLTMNSVHLAVSTGGSSININKNIKITFGGSNSATIPAGQDLTSDTLNYNLPPLTNMAITIFFGNVPSELTGHPGSRTTSYIQKGNVVNHSKMSSSSNTDHWYVIKALDILTDYSYKTVVAYGDSITDGRGTTTNKNNRWTDFLATHLVNNSYNVGIINQGIGATTSTISGIERFNRDVLEQSGVRYLIVLYGINDILFGNVSSSEIINSYKIYITKAHNNGILVYGGTLLPFGTSDWFDESLEQNRQNVNKWITTTSVANGGFDSVIDFDTALKDCTTTKIKLTASYDCGDGLHPSPAGFEKMANIINLSLFSE